MKWTVGLEVRSKFLMTLKEYCESRNISYNSLSRGFISLRAARKLRADGIWVVPTTVQQKTQQ
jgi:hypothetical protein